MSEPSISVVFLNNCILRSFFHLLSPKKEGPLGGVLLLTLLAGTIHSSCVIYISMYFNPSLADIMLWYILIGLDIRNINYIFQPHCWPPCEYRPLRMRHLCIEKKEEPSDFAGCRFLYSVFFCFRSRPVYQRRQ